MLLVLLQNKGTHNTTEIPKMLKMYNFLLEIHITKAETKIRVLPKPRGKRLHLMSSGRVRCPNLSTKTPTTLKHKRYSGSVVLELVTSNMEIG
jgi:hypothetical protein